MDWVIEDESDLFRIADAWRMGLMRDATFVSLYGTTDAMVDAYLRGQALQYG